MVAFTLASSIALLVSIASATAIPFSADANSGLQVRQEQLPAECTDFCSEDVDCVCIRRPTNCVANYTVASGETCGSIIDRFDNFTGSALYKWNPEIGRECFGLLALVPVCVGVTGYQYPGAVLGGDIWPSDQLPVPVQPGIVQNCTKFVYTDSAGVPTLAQIFSRNNITQQQWNTWNYPTQDVTKDWSLWAGYFSCVAA